MTLAAGRLRHRILIERYTLDVDSSGEAIQDPDTGETSSSWVEVATVWAEIKPISVREFIAAQATQSKIEARVVLRYRPDLDGSLRLVHMVNGVRGKIYNPAGFLPDPESGMEYLTSPVSTGVTDSGQ